MQLGRELHQEFQVRNKKEIEKEVFIKYIFDIENTKVTIKGRIDGVSRKNKIIEIIEIKTANKIPKKSQIENEDGEYYHYYMQLMLYSFFYSEINNKSLNLIKSKLVFINHVNKEEKHFIFESINLKEYIINIVLDVLNLHKKKKEFNTQRVKGGNAIAFPYKFHRNYQEKMIKRIKNSLETTQKNLMVTAPTGIGKTVASLYPILEYALKNNKRVFFCHSRTTQQAIVVKTIQDINKQMNTFSSSIFAICLTAKEKICLREEKICDPEICKYLKNYHFPDFETLEHAFKEKIITREWIQNLSEKLVTCPFELQLDLSLFADLVIGDFNYVFNPQVFLKRFFIDKRISKDFILIIDEAHSLYNRSLSYYSPIIPKIMLEELKEKNYSNKSLDRAKNTLLDKLLAYFDEIHRLSKNNKKILIELDTPFLNSIQKSFEDLVFDIFYKYKLIDESDLFSSFSILLKYFVQLASLKAENFKHVYDPNSDEIKIVCLDASSFLERRMKMLSNTIAMSATLAPTHFFMRVLGFKHKNVDILELPIPFPKKNRKIIIDKRFDTRYTAREKNASLLATQIIKISEKLIGNYIVFFPSFQYLESIRKRIKRRRNWRLLIQKRNMDFRQTKSIFKILKQRKVENKGCLVFAVQSGIYAEGVDYPDSLLDGIIIISPGTLMPSFERELIRKYYDSKELGGFDYAYISPGINRVIQAAGRLIRSEKDVGIIYLIGKRFTDNTYSKYLPKDWFKESSFELVHSSPENVIEEFWEKVK